MGISETARVTDERRTIRALIVEDHQLLIDALHAALATTSVIEVVGSAVTVSAAMTLVNAVKADVVLLDYRLPDGNGVDAGTQMMASRPGIRVILVTGSQNDDVFLDALKVGFAGCISKSDDLSHLADAVVAAAAGVTAWSPDLLARAMAAQSARLPGSDLSRRERDVLRLLAEGVSTDEMAEALGISHNTLRNHIQNAMEKLGCHTRVEAVAEARRLGIVGDRGFD